MKLPKGLAQVDMTALDQLAEFRKLNEASTARKLASKMTPTEEKFQAIRLGVDIELRKYKVSRCQHPGCLRCSVVSNIFCQLHGGKGDTRFISEGSYESVVDTVARLMISEAPILLEDFARQVRETFVTIMELKQLHDIPVRERTQHDDHKNQDLPLDQRLLAFIDKSLTWMASDLPMMDGLTGKELAACKSYYEGRASVHQRFRKTFAEHFPELVKPKPEVEDVSNSD